MRPIFALVVSCLVLTRCVYASPAVDSVEVNMKDVTYFHASDFMADYPMGTELDTTLEMFRFWSPVSSKVPYLWLGNQSTAAQKLVFEPTALNPIGISMKDNFEVHKFQADDVRFYNSKKRMSELTYFQGSKKMQSMLVNHSQNLTPNLNLGIDFKRSGSLGYYQRQSTSVTNFNVYEWYHTKNNQYIALVSLTGNRIKAKLNGGIEEDFYYGIPDQKPDQIPVTLLSSDTKINERELRFSQYLNFGPKKDVRDTSALHLDSLLERKLMPVFQISHSFSRVTKATTYKDEIAPVAMFYDSLTLDSLHFKTYKNTISFTTKPYSYKDDSKERTTKYVLSVHHLYTKYHQRIIDTTLTGLATEFQTDGYAFNFLSWGLNALSGVTAETNKNYRLRVYTYVPITKQKDFFGISASTQQTAPDFRLNHFESNLYRWENAFSPTITDEFSAGLYSNRFHLMLSSDFYAVTNPIYFGTNALPQQFRGKIGIVVVNLKKNFKLGKWNLQNTVVYQSTDNDIVRVPEFSFSESFYYESFVSKKAGRVCIGTDFRWYSALLANTYMPATDVFFQQDDTEIGSYPVFDVFFMLKVKRARLFLKYEHANQDLTGINAWASPHNPLPGRMFVMGINWKFFD